jgi:hypothetical protein
MPANIQELTVALSKTAQTAIDVPSGDLVRFNTTSDDLADWMPVVEDDADEIGKGHEFAEESFLTSYKVTKKIQCYNSAEAFAIAAAFGLGSGNGGTYTPIDPITNVNEIELPWMTVLEGIRKGGATQVLNRAFTGMVIDKWNFTLGKGPGRANSKIEIDLVGTGRVDEASGLAMPAKTPTHLLPAASLTCAINGTDYVTARTFESAQFTWDNALRDGYFPGSGFQIPGDPTSGQVQGRMEFGKRKCEFFFVARYQFGSTELATLTAQTAGTAVLGLTGGAGFEATLTLGQCKFKTTKIENVDGIVSVRVDVSAQVNPTVGLASLVTITANNALGAVGRA